MTPTTVSMIPRVITINGPRFDGCMNAGIELTRKPPRKRLLSLSLSNRTQVRHGNDIRWLTGSCRPSHAPSGRHHPYGLAVDEAADVLDHAGEVVLIVLECHIAEMRREHDVVHLAQGMILGQRLDIEHVEAGAGNLLVAQDREHGSLIDDGAA